jgi:hypothetical protein
MIFATQILALARLERGQASHVILIRIIYEVKDPKLVTNNVK